MNIGLWEWLAILAVVVLIFGTKKLRNLGGDLGGAIKSFKSALREGEQDAGKKPDDVTKAPGDPDKPGA